MYFWAEAASLVLTFLTLQLCVEVVHTWRHEAIKFFSGDREPWGWAGLGICLHFFVSTIDNFYWGIAWSLDFMEHPDKDWWFQHGVFSNIPFRQIGTSLAGFCYIRAAYLFHQRDLSGVQRRMFYSLLIGALYVYLISP